MSARIPLHILTGFLGSGKTTLLNRLLRDPAWADTAVLINEFGAVSIDHELVDSVASGDAIDIITLKGGCTCCALRGDLVGALLELYARRADGRVPAFGRVVFETSGLADPTPVLFTLAGDPTLRHKFERGTVVTTFDALNGLSHLSRFAELRKQIAVADRVVVTKSDIATARYSELSAAVRALNPIADMSDAASISLPDVLFARTDVAARNDGDEEERGSTAKKLGDLRHVREQSLWCDPIAVAEHAADIESIALELDQPIDWATFAVWLTMFVHAHGEKLLRFKAILNIADTADPVSLDAVHHLVYPPRHIERRPGAWPASSLVFIGQGIPLNRIEGSLRSFLAEHHPPQERAAAFCRSASA